MIPLSVPYISKEEIEVAIEVLQSGWIAHGQKNEELERNFAKYQGVKYAVLFNSCASALQIAIQASNLKGEIITPSFTFVASTNAIINGGCKPVFIDVDYDTCNMDSSKIEDKITDKTVGIMPVHFAGQSCKMDEIMEIARKHDLVVIEDSAEAIGAEYRGKRTGTFGIGCFSFWATKNMTTGEGGILTTNDENLAERASVLRGHGNPTTTLEREGMKIPWKRDCVIAGYNFRMSNILAGIGVIQLRKLEKMNNLRREHANYYNNHLKSDEIEKPVELKECRHVYQMYTIKVKNVDRDRFVFQLRKKGIGASVHFDPPVHLCTYYQFEHGNEELPVTEKISKSIVTLPMYPQLTRKQLDTVISSVEEVVKTCKK